MFNRQDGFGIRARSVCGRGDRACRGRTTLLSRIGRGRYTTTSVTCIVQDAHGFTGSSTATASIVMLPPTITLAGWGAVPGVRAGEHSGPITVTIAEMNSLVA